MSEFKPAKTISDFPDRALVVIRTRGLSYRKYFLCTARHDSENDAPSSLDGDDLGDVEIVSYVEVDSLLDAGFQSLETIPMDGRDFLLKRTDPSHPFAQWSIAKAILGHIHFRTGGGGAVYPGNAGQMSKFDGWLAIPGETQ